MDKKGNSTQPPNASRQVEDSGYFGAELRAVAMRGAKAATTVAVILPPASYVEANGRLRGWCHPQGHAAKAPPLLESVELTPGGRRKHVLTRQVAGRYAAHSAVHLAQQGRDHVEARSRIMWRHVELQRPDC